MVGMTSRAPIRYLVCATPRSGSTLLCETLRATGIAGTPLEHFQVLTGSGRPRQPREYFEGVSDRGVLDLLAPLQEPLPETESPKAWWARIRAEGATPNGVWGGKLMWGHVPDFLERAHELPGLGQADLATVLDGLLGPDLHLIHVTRADKVAQAVSLWRAVQTQTWRAGDADAPASASYAFAGIDHLVGQLEEQDDAWRAWFAEHGRDPFVVSYDALAADVGGVIASVLRHLGLPDDAVPPAATRRQGDGRSQDWAERYRRERGVVV
jgi:trehalose 2-sulfotransferase